MDGAGRDADGRDGGGLPHLEGGSDRDGVTAAPGGLLDLLRVSAFVLDATGRIVLWSPEAERLFGYTAQEALGSYAGRLLVAERHLSLVKDLFARVMAGARWSGVFPIQCRDGSMRPMEFRNMRLRDVDGEVYALGLAADAKTVRQLETDLAMSNSLVNQSPIGMALFDTDLRWLRINPALERMNGLPAEAMLGRKLADVLPTVDVQAVERALQHVMETGEPLLDQQTIGRTAADPEQDHVWSVSYYRIDDPRGHPLGMAASAIDVTERHRAAAEVAEARERLAVIADAGFRIGTTLDLQQTARELAEVAVPRLADFAAVDVLDSVLSGEVAMAVQSDGSARFRALAVAAADETDATRAADRVGELASYGPSRVITQSVREARPILLPEVSASMMRRIAKDEESAAMLEDEGVHSYLAAPLIARGDVLGTVSLYRTRNPRPFDDQDLTLAAELAARAAICVDNARLYSRERNAALTLQRSLLPDRPPDYEGIDIASRYRPAVSEVGGDWFDVLPLKDNKLGLIVGDVMGKGVHAAAIMGQLRTATRAFARLDLPPAELLRHLDDILAALGDSIATCLYAVCDPVHGWCELSSAGHLPPILVHPDGRSELVDIPNAVPLGVGGIPFSTERRELAEDTTLALFTDGLVEERRAPIDEGLDALLLLLAGEPRPLEETCDTVLAALHRMPQDDVALLLARRASSR
ncbi:SpoIIE family protein phosphatase [Streptomyces gobiensis]|uniref:SpoIIE family protein phosphatase n=1 Tax=Streptomyces gobiensis TaxID=2875706 RepID=UPI001E2EC5C5|nr:SpoIIE family protein phosphatase [Streptomyces gobiensis]UGY94771.1 SpoIIE family protein phosphatase [Streptomyces gobiensis]